MKKLAKFIRKLLQWVPWLVLSSGFWKILERAFRLSFHMLAILMRNLKRKLFQVVIKKQETF